MAAPYVAVKRLALDRELGWFSNRKGTSFDDGKAPGKDYTWLPVSNLPLSYWSSQLFDLHAPSSTDVPVLLLNQSTIRKDLPVGRIHTCACAHTPCEQSFLSFMAFSVNEVVHVALCRVVGFIKQTNYATESHANDFVQDGNLLTFIM